MVSKQKEALKKRANGLAAREKILDAAAEIACERGYEGTSISLVSKLSGHPASSIYWHFKNKDDLIAAVIERSFKAWLKVMSDIGPATEGTPLEAQVEHQSFQAIKALALVPDFLRLGLMLALEKRPEEPAARKMFREVRANALKNSKKTYQGLLPDLDTDDIDAIARYSIALADGMFVAKQTGDETSDIANQYDLHAAALLGIINHLRNKKK